MVNFLNLKVLECNNEDIRILYIIKIICEKNIFITFKFKVIYLLEFIFFFNSDILFWFISYPIIL